MKRKIYKFPLKITDTQTVEMPPSAKILTAQMQNGNLCLWALVDAEPELEKQPRVIEIIGTGNPFPERLRRYISTVQISAEVWHVFEQ